MPSGEKICPFCFTVYAPGVLDDDYPFCRECSNFGRSIFVETEEEFLAHTNLADLVSLLGNWQSRQHFLEAEKGMIETNLHKMIERLKN